MKKAAGLKAKLIKLTISLGKKKLLGKKMSITEKFLNRLVDALVRKKVKKSSINVKKMDYLGVLNISQYLLQTMVK